MGLEILEQVPDVDALVIPVGGGGLIAGCAKAVKTMKPDVKIIVSGLYCCSSNAAWSAQFVPCRESSLNCVPVSRPP